MSAPALAGVADRLAAAGVPSPRPEARWLLEHATALAGDRDGPAREAILDGLVDRRSRRTPLQHIVGATWFRHLRLSCRPGVFIPRPETEVVAGLAIDLAADLTVEAAAGRERPVVLEPCTGTGAIALSVAAEVEGASVLAGDIDRRSVALARHNLARLRVGRAGPEGLARDADVRILRSDLFAGFDEALRGSADVVVANPPYLPAAERSTWPPEVADHDPAEALIGGADGFEVLTALLAAAPEWLRPGGVVIVEIDERRGQMALEEAGGAGLSRAELASDLAGADRALVATL